MEEIVLFIDTKMVMITNRFVINTFYCRDHPK